MSSYENFASVYDMSIDNVDYEKWGGWLKRALAQYGVDDGTVCELGCGTGTMTELLAAAGYDMIGIDNSEDMLAEAVNKRYESGHNILYLQQDMREIELYGTVRAFVSVCDSINYILEEEDLRSAFDRVARYLDEGGVFAFDLNTDAKYRAIGEQTIAENRDTGSFIWENFYDEEERINEYDLTLFLPEDRVAAMKAAEAEELYEGPYYRTEEVHLERAWETPLIQRLLAEAGFTLKTMTDSYTDEPANEKSERICYIAVKENANDR